MTPHPVSRRTGGRGSLPIRFDRQALINQLAQVDDQLEDILAKRPQDLTEGEVRQIAKQRLALPAGEEKEKLHAVEQAFFERVYGSDAAQPDGTGRFLSPEVKHAPNASPVPARTADGMELNKAVNLLTEKVVDLAESHGTRDAVRFLQRGLSIMNQAYGETMESQPPEKGRAPGFLVHGLKEDGDPGPKTRQALRRTANRLGVPKIEEAIALGRFESALRELGRGTLAEDIKQSAAEIFSPLFREPSPTHADQIASEEGESLQMTLNDLGTSMLGERAFKSLREDGVIGRKTAAALSRVLAAAGPRRLTEAMGRNLGFFLFETPNEEGRSLLNHKAADEQPFAPGKNFAR